MTPANPADGEFAVLERLLRGLGLEPRRDDALARFHIAFGDGVPLATAFAAIAPDTRRFVFSIALGFDVAAARRDEVAHLLARLNWRLVVGSFDIDYADGQVRFRVGIDYSGAELTEPLMRNAIRAAMDAVESHAGNIVRVAAGVASAEEAAP